jgi:arylsulfatase A-like enzyme
MATPFLNSLAQAGVILQNYHTEPVCSPTRGSLMTGMYPHKICLQVSGPQVQPAQTCTRSHTLLDLL